MTACRIKCYIPTRAVDEDSLAQAIVAQVAEYDRYGYRRITALLREAGWPVVKRRECCILAEV